MKIFITILSTLLVLGISFYGLSIISKQNEFTSVREYLLKKDSLPTIVSDSGSTESSSGSTNMQTDITPPIIEIINYKNGDIVNENTIDVQLQYSDNITPTNNIVTTGGGVKNLETGFNSIVVSAKDEAGNIGTTYIIIEKK